MMDNVDLLLAEVRAIREEQRATRLMLARTMAMLIGMTKPMTAEQAEIVERRLMASDEPEAHPFQNGMPPGATLSQETVRRLLREPASSLPPRRGPGE